MSSAVSLVLQRLLKQAVAQARSVPLLAKPCQCFPFIFAEALLCRKAEAQVQQVVDVVAPGPLKVSHHSLHCVFNARNYCACSVSSPFIYETIVHH